MIILILVIAVIAPQPVSAFVIMPSIRPLEDTAVKSNGDILNWSIQKQKQVSAFEATLEPTNSPDYSDFDTEVVDLTDPLHPSHVVESIEIQNDREPEEIDSSEIMQHGVRRVIGKEDPLRPHWWDLVDHPQSSDLATDKSIRLPDPPIIEVNDYGLFDD